MLPMRGGAADDSAAKTPRAAVLRSNYLNDGDVTTAFEAIIAALFAPHASHQPVGRPAIFSGAGRAGVGPGRRSGSSPTYVHRDPPTPGALTGCDARASSRSIRYANIDPQHLRDSSPPPMTKAIVPLHVSGDPRTAPLLSIAASHGLAVIEGCGRGPAL